MGWRRQDVRAAFGFNAKGDLKKVVWIDKTFGMTARLARSECTMASLTTAILNEQDARAVEDVSGLELAQKAHSARCAPHRFQRWRVVSDFEQFHPLETVAHIEAGIGGI
jgi:hypothetical protein